MCIFSCGFYFSEDVQSDFKHDHPKVTILPIGPTDIILAINGLCCSFILLFQHCIYRVSDISIQHFLFRKLKFIYLEERTYKIFFYWIYYHSLFLECICYDVYFLCISICRYVIK